jgi:glutathione S-transferase
MTDAVPTLYLPDFATLPIVGCSPPGWACQLALEEKSVMRTDHWLDFAAGAHRTPEMLARNPRGTVPVLEHGEHVVYETQAILAYIDQTWRMPVLLPPRFRASALTRLHEASHLQNAGMDLFGWLMRSAASDRTPERMAARVTVLWRELQRWETHLDGQDFVAGPWLSLADLLVYPYLATAKRLGLDLSRELPRLEAYAARMRSRSAVIRTWPEPWADEQGPRPLAGL